MPTYSADVIPSSTGLNLGSASLQWNAFIQNLVLSGTFTAGSSVLTLPGATDTLVGRATTDTLTNKTIDTSGPNTLKIAGTSLTAVTGTGSVVLATSPTLTTPVFSSITNTGVLTLPTSTDTLVGRTTTDSLTNKTFTGAGSGNAMSLLSAQAATGALTGNAAAQTVFTYSIPANTVQAGKGIRVKFAAAHGTGTAAVTWTVKLGTTSVVGVAAAAAANNIFIEANIYNTSGQTAQAFHIFGIDGITTDPFINANGSIAENLANTTALAVQFTVANTDQVTGKFFLVELIQ